MPSGPKFIRFFWPILTGLRELGGSAKPREVVDLVVEMLDIPDEERAERTKSGSLRVDNQIHWARNYLVWAGLLDGSQRGRWQLSNAGWSLALEDQDHASAYELFKRVRAEHGEEWGHSAPDDNTDPGAPPKAGGCRRVQRSRLGRAGTFDTVGAEPGRFREALQASSY